MYIEFHIPAGEVNEWLIEHMKEQLVELHHYEPAFVRAQVFFKNNGGLGKTVEVDIPTFGTSLFIHRSSSTYEEAMRDVLRELQQKVMERYEARNEPPDEMVSSVDAEPPSEDESAGRG